jgi:hypothetical protein
MPDCMHCWCVHWSVGPIVKTTCCRCRETREDAKKG